MKRLAGWSALILMVMAMLTGMLDFRASASEPSVTILFTHDLHDNLLPFKQEQNGKLKEYGGYARLQTVIDRQRAQDPDLLLLDGGDFSMGTLFQTIFSQEAPSLRIMGQMGYDAATLGNHEFDFRPAGLADSLIAAKASRENLPIIVQGNITYPVNKDGTLSPSLRKLKQAMNACGVNDYTILNRKGYKIGIFGIIGKDAASNAPMAGVKFTDPVEQARRIVNKLENKEKVDMIICLSHSGTVSDKEKSEDVILAKEVPEIDVIISGHTHTTLNKPVLIGHTLICSSGEYGKNLGMVTLDEKSAGIWERLNYRLIPIGDNIPEDNTIKMLIEQFKTKVQKSYLDPLQMKFDGILANSSFGFPSISQIQKQHAEQPLADLICDSYIYAVRQAEGKDYQPVDVAIIPNGTIRASFVKGDITVADAFNASSLGIGPDKKSGYPLISIYLTGKELKTACEVDASITSLMPEAQLYMSGLTYTFNPHRLMFNKVTRVALQDADSSQEIDDTRLYRVVAGLYSAQMLSVVGDKSFGLLSIVPKDKRGIPVTNFEARIIKDTAGGTNNEIKEWAALAEYLQSFVRVNGVSQMPAYYNEKHDRKIIDNRATIGAILAKPNSIALAFYGLIILILLLVILIVSVVIKRRKNVLNDAGHTPDI
ncbi:MAG TPA: bifunctional UDP-sugar hydrolase/5'-nucleotidase [Syntrophomonadaceae bacterium]|nr:bifunctional UDP-sugar hydrolase/5'-nucleotidase [Syntrophomonadaceae bacterium]